MTHKEVVKTKESKMRSPALMKNIRYVLPKKEVLKLKRPSACVK